MTRLPRAVQVLVVVVALLAGGCAYLQTSHGFTSVAVPVASAFAPGSLEVRSGRLGLGGGTLVLEGVQYTAPELGVEATVEAFAVNLGLWSLVFGTPHVETLTLHGARLELSPSEAEDADEEEPEEEDAVDINDLIEQLRFVPASVGEADVRDVEVLLLNEAGARTAIGPVGLRVSRLVAGETGTIELSTQASVSDEKEGIDFRGDLRLEAEVAQGSGGGIEQIDAGVVANSAQGLGGEPIRFDLDLESRVEGGNIDAGYALVAQEGGTRLGEASGTLATAETREGNDALEASLALRDITESFLNPIIAPLGRGLVKRARIDGEFELIAELPVDTSRLPQLAKGSLAIGRFDYRALAISEAELGFEASTNALRVELLPTRINRGRVSGQASFLASDEQDRLEAELRTTALDLGALSRSFREEVPRAVEGILNLSASLQSEAPPGTDVRQTARGNISTKLSRGRIEGLNIMAFLAQESGVEAFKAIPLDDFNVDANAKITDGVARLNEASVNASAVELLINGTVALMGSLDLTIEAFVGPSLAAGLGRLGVKLPSLAAAERLVGVPAAIRVSGPVDNLAYGPAVARTPERAGKATESGTKALKDATDKVMDWFK